MSGDMLSSSIEVAKLSTISAFGALSEETIKFLVTHGKAIQLKAGDHLFHCGDSANEFYIVLTASIRLFQSSSGENRFVREYLPGDQVGVSAMITLNPRHGDGIASIDCEELGVGSAVFHDLYNQSHQDFVIFLMNMFRDMARGLKKERESLLEASVPK
ncbi:cyclic nucleotide-binding domain-containing protein [Amphritea sp. 2_MG-2023]|uniref:Crp/Fnr family transcriptional regulator n=1 Tax=Amphritea TaxID=515417 RepID=UPI001C075808|nr:MULTISPECIES: cyclic nucleotide-binding domain-containing protein [Amphritea]MBU2966761.1 cyclic nucleotide-binding domain-containing protein [Amphritea atlantica]MDO6418972.1 cyclic nucleotide-binding domain-containing protein [Amphritea sp. 2_MG-2023]